MARTGSSPCERVSLTSEDLEEANAQGRIGPSPLNERCGYGLSRGKTQKPSLNACDCPLLLDVVGEEVRAANPSTKNDRGRNQAIGKWVRHVETRMARRESTSGGFAIATAPPDRIKTAKGQNPMSAAGVGRIR